MNHIVELIEEICKREQEYDLFIYGIYIFEIVTIEMNEFYISITFFRI